VRKDHQVTPVAAERNDALPHPAPLVAVAGEIDQGSKKMKVNVQVVRLAAVYEALGRNEKIEVEFPGGTVRELIDTLVGEFGTNVRKALLNQNGDFNAGIRILLNGVIHPVETIMRAILKEGDTLIFRAPS
jgi:molybdopterin converting factor small subunit